jgi:hypothetical protein
MNCAKREKTCKALLLPMFNKMLDNVPTFIIQGNFWVGNSNTFKTHTHTNTHFTTEQPEQAASSQ